jgi:hypothetical protein
MGGTSFPGVFALAASGANLYAGGLFSSAGGTGAADLAKWNGTSWSGINTLSVSSNYYPAVSTLALSGTNLYVGGDFTKANSSAVNRIARWDSASWSGLGSGMNTNVSALLVSGTDLYVGGSFTNAGGKPCNYIARAYLPPLPALSTVSSGNSVTVFWPSAETGDFVLEQTVDPVAANWIANTDALTNDGTNRSVTVPATNDHLLFRLRRP